MQGLWTAIYLAWGLIYSLADAIAPAQTNRPQYPKAVHGFLAPIQVAGAKKHEQNFG